MNGFPVMTSPIAAPTTESGIDVMMMSGCRTVRNWNSRMKNTPSREANSATFTATGAGTTAPFTFAVTAGALPDGLSLAANGDLTGTPTVAGDFTFTVTATDSTPGGSGGPFTGSRQYTVTVLDTIIFFDGFEDP